MTKGMEEGSEERVPTIGSLFAGIGGFDLGFERAGFRTVWQCEIDKAAQGVLRRRFPEAALHADVRTVGAHNLAPVDVVTFGSPCQDLSVAGKRAGLAGERSGLFHEAARVIRELRERYGSPRFAIWENVPGAFSSNGGADFAAVVQAMVDLGARDVAWRVLDSRYFGVAQRRRRVFLVADFGGERAEQVLFESESLRGDFKKGGKKRKEAARGAGAGTASDGWGDPAVTSKRAKGAGGPAGDECQNLVTQPMLPVASFDPLNITSKANRTKVEYGRPCHTLHSKEPAVVIGEVQPIAFAQNTRDEVRLMGGDGNIVGALAAQPGMKQTTYVAQAVEPFTLAIRGRGDGRNLEYRNDGTANALLLPNGGRDGIGPGAVAQAIPDLAGTLGGGSGSRGWANDLDRNGAFIPLPLMQVRRLVPQECEKLQGFPRNWTAETRLPNGTTKPQADGPRYKQLGNAVTVNVANWIAQRLLAVWRAE